MKLKFYIKRLKKENFSLKFIFSRIILRMNLTLPLKVRLDDEIEGKIYLHPSPFSHKLFIKKNYYKSDNLVVKKFVKEGDVVFDIGADLGALSILFSRLCGNGKVYAFEPTRRTFGFLLDNIKLNGINNIFSINAAVSDINGIVGLVEHKYSHGFNYIDGRQRKDTVNVLSFRLDSFLDMFGLAKIDFLKIDAEGSELPVLKSLGKRIRDVKIIYFEFHPKNYLRAGYQPREVIDILKNNQFEIFIPMPKGRRLNIVPLKQQRTYTEKINLIAFNTNM